MGLHRTCGGPDGIELAAIGVELNGLRRVHEGAPVAILLDANVGHAVFLHQHAEDDAVALRGGPEAEAAQAYRTKRNKTKQNETKRNRTKQNETERNKPNQNKPNQNKAGKKIVSGG